jgi:hypothetical protein
MKKPLFIILIAVILLAALSLIPVNSDALIPVFRKAISLYANADVGAAHLSIRLLRGISFKDLRIVQKDGLIIIAASGTLSYDLTDIMRRQFRIRVRAKDVTIGRGPRPVKGFLESFLLPDPEASINFANAVFSLNFYGGAKELENLQMIGDDVIITGCGTSIGKRSMNYTLMLYLSQKAGSKLLAQFGNSSSEDSPSRIPILLRIYGQPSAPFVYIVTQTLRLSFKVGATHE